MTGAERYHANPHNPDILWSYDPEEHSLVRTGGRIDADMFPTAERCALWARLTPRGSTTVAELQNELRAIVEAALHAGTAIQRQSVTERVNDLCRSMENPLA